jgi:signal transduction histidine kinase
MMKRLNQILTTLLILAAILFTSCEEHQASQHKDIAADSLINSAYKVRDYNLILNLADLHQQAGTLSNQKACYWRGYAYSRQRKMRMAEMEWKTAISLSIDDEEDLEYYAHSANRLAGLLFLKSDYSEAIRVAVAATTLLKKENYTMNTDYANLLTFIGSCQLKIGHFGEAANNYALAWQHYQQITEEDKSIVNYTSSIVGIVNIVDAYIQTSHYHEAIEWINRFDDMLQLCRLHPQAKEEFIDKQTARLNLYRSCALEGLGRKKEAERAYNTALETQYAKTSDGKLEATSYLMAAQRWNEAADKFQVLETQENRYDLKMTLDNIQTYLLPKYLANVGAHRIDSAIVIGTRICHSLDSAIMWQKQDDAAELATIYETQQKESEIMEQQANISKIYFIGTTIALVLVVFAFCLFIFFRHRSSMRLEAAYHDLELANARAEESSRMKSDFIQQISHEIRTPLNVLSGFTQVLTTPDMMLDETTLKNINQKITENTNRITGLVNKMLELSEAKSHTVIKRSDIVSAEQIAIEATNASGITNASHLIFDMQISPSAKAVNLQTNQTAAIRALSLLLDNARKFTAPAEARKQDNTSDIKQRAILRLSVASKRLFFSVEDTGIGIPRKEAERIFEEFVQLDEYYDGTGIGLTVARSLARRIGGDIMLDTAYIGGSRFVMTLPINAV